jgi:PAS domain-containing protein
VNFVVGPHRLIFNTFLEQIFTTKRKDSCRVDLEREHRPTITVQIEINLSSQAPECRAVVVDITERKQMEQRLLISEERYRRLAETAIDVIWTMNLEGKFTFFSPSVMQLRGFTPEEVMEQSFEDIFPPHR